MSTTQNKTPTTRNTRTSISYQVKEQIFAYVRQHRDLTNREILKWVQANIRSNFAQSTLSTLLSKHNLITKQKGRRGRPVKENKNSFAVPSRNTGIYKLSPGRCRNREFTNHMVVEHLLIQEIIKLLGTGQVDLTESWLKQRAFEILKAHKPELKGRNASQFVESLKKKYWTGNIVDKYLQREIDYVTMIETLSQEAKELAFSPRAPLEEEHNDQQYPIQIFNREPIDTSQNLSINITLGQEEQNMSKPQTQIQEISYEPPYQALQLNYLMVDDYYMAYPSSLPQTQDCLPESQRQAYY